MELGGEPRDYVCMRVRQKPWRATHLGIKGSHLRPVGHRDSEAGKGREAQQHPERHSCVFPPVAFVSLGNMAAPTRPPVWARAAPRGSGHKTALPSPFWLALGHLRRGRIASATDGSPDSPGTAQDLHAFAQPEGHSRPSAGVLIVCLAR